MVHQVVQVGLDYQVEYWIWYELFKKSIDILVAKIM